MSSHPAGFRARRAAVEQAERELDVERRTLRQHTRAFANAGRALRSPLPLLLGGLAAGLLIGHWRHAAKRRRQAASGASEPPREALPSPIDTLMRAMNLAAAAMPVLMPLIARRSAEKAIEAVEPAAVRQDQSLH